MLSSRSSQCTVVSIVLSVTVCETVLASPQEVQVEELPKMRYTDVG